MPKSIISEEDLLRFEIIRLTEELEAVRRSESVLRARLEETPSPVFVQERETRVLMESLAEEALRASEERYHALFNSMTHACMLCEMLCDEAGVADDFRFLEVNPAFESFSGIKSEDMIGKKARDAFPEVGKDNWVEICGQVAFTGRAAHINGYRDSRGLYFDVTVFCPQLGLFAMVLSDVTARRRSEDALYESQQMLQLILDTIPQRVFWKDREFRYLGCNLPFAMDAGLSTPNAIIGKTDFELPWGRETAEAFRVDDRHVMDTGEAKIGYEEPQVRPDGKQSWVVTSKTPLRDRENRVFGVLGTYEDISKRKEAEEALMHYSEECRITDHELRKLSSAVEQSPATVIITDRTGIIEYINPRFLGQTGYSAAEVIGQNPNVLKSGVHPPEFYEHLWTTILNGDTWRGEICNKAKNGKLYWESTSISPIRDAIWEVTHFVAISVDVTEQKESAKELQLAKETAEAASRAKSVFLANMSHEIRTPMNAILGFSQLMLRYPALTPHQKKSLGIINRSGEHLLTLINDILEMSKIEAGRTTLNLAPFDLQAMLNELHQMFLERVDAKRLRFTFERQGEMQRCVVGDENKLRQVLINLIGNAIKFTDRGSIVVRVHLAPTSGDASELRFNAKVEDTGGGISEEEMTRLFQSFEQTQTGRRAGGGTGLGLTISREFVRLMGGDVSVMSQVGKGSTFGFEVILKKGEEAALSQARDVMGGTPKILEKGFLVLIADDVEDNRNLLGDMMGGAGFDFCEAVNGIEAVELFERRHPNLVLMDMRMPVMDGYDAIRRIRAAEGGSDVKIISLTAGALEEERQGAMAAGADAFLTKPFRDSELFEMIRSLLDVEYVYPDQTIYTPSADVGLSGDLSTESLRTLPAELIARLREAVVCAEFDAALESVAVIETLNAAVAHELRRLVEKFNSKRLLQLLPIQPT